MEVIEKHISLERFKSRHPSLIPYYDVENEGACLELSSNGNWGKYPCDIDIRQCNAFTSLESYFGGNRVSFNQIKEKWYFFDDFLKSTKYYRKGEKNNEIFWETYEPLFVDKLEIGINLTLDEVYDNLVGINENADEFSNNGGLTMLKFVIKALGLFAIDNEYIKSDNYVPEVMYYDAIDSYRNMLKKMKKGEDCCVKGEYEKYGGDAFYIYLGSKLKEKKIEFEYWKGALYTNENGEYVSSDMSLSLSLISDFNNVGILTTVEPLEEYDYITSDYVDYGIEIPFYPETDVNGNNIRERKWVTESLLKTLKRTQKSYAYDVLKGEEIELPVILEGIDGEVSKFRFSPKYEVGKAKNVKIYDNLPYGDVIYDISISGNVATVKYVIGGQLELNDDGTYDYDESTLTGIRFQETLFCEYHNYVTDKTIEIRQLMGVKEVNILDLKRIENEDNALIIYDNETKDVEGTFFMDYTDDLTNYKVIGIDYNLGKTEGLIENIEDIIIDRGYTSAFELHYKMGEVNSFEDLANYQNNIFGV
jgi:hypothetical protein